LKNAPVEGAARDRRVMADLFDLPAHPLAAIFPLLPDDELADLAASIKLNGQRDPIILGEWQDDDGRTIKGVIDGRNRLRACKLAEITPKFEQLNGADPKALIWDRNVFRRNVTMSQRAMAWAKLYPEPETLKRKSDVSQTNISRERLSVARTVLHELPDKVDGILAGASLNAAYDEVLARRKAAATEDAQIARLAADAPDLHELFIDDKLPLAEAIAALDQRIKEQAAVENNKRETMLRLSEAAYRGCAAWASDEFAQDVQERLGDIEFRKQLIERLHLDRSRIAAINQGARVFTKLLNALAKDLS
jgi:ParB-like chromosome segregation protein Spo0J